MLLSRRHLPLNALRAFEAVGHRGHVRQAAQDLGVTHGAVSRQIKLLEETLEVSLFHRDRRKLTLTSAGTRLLKAVGESFDAITESVLYLDPSTMSGPLYIASTPSIANSWLIKMIGRFNQQYPEVEIHLLSIEPRQQQLPSQFDVAICFGEPTIGGYESVALYRENFFPVCSPLMLKTEIPINKPSEILQYPLLRDRHNHWQRWLQKMGLGNKRALRSMHLGEGYQALAAAQQGFGVALADQIEVIDELKAGTLIRLCEETVASIHAMYLVTQTERHENLRAKVFAEWISDLVRESE